MEGAHSDGRALNDVVVGSRSTASQQRQRAQRGAAASARKVHVVQRARAKKKSVSDEDAACEQEAIRCLEKGRALVQAAVEHVETAERAWDRWVEDSNVVIDGYPTMVQVVTFIVIQ